MLYAIRSPWAAIPTVFRYNSCKCMIMYLINTLPCGRFLLILAMVMSLSQPSINIYVEGIHHSCRSTGAVG